MARFEIFSGEGLELKLGGHYQFFEGTEIRRLPVLAARNYKKGSKEIPITESDLENMAELFRSGALGPMRPITKPLKGKAHPDLASTPAAAWMHTDRAEVSSYKGGKALYVGVDFKKDTEQAIMDKEYAYISPVFTKEYADQDGNERGPALLGAGLLNDPHWTDQVPLWEQFSAESYPATDAANNQPGRIDMDELKKAQAEISTLKAGVASRDERITAFEAEVKEFKTKVESFESAASKNVTMDAQVKGLEEQFKASEARVTTLEAERKTEKGDLLIEKYQREREVKPAHIKNAEDKLTGMGQAAYDNPSLFIEFAMAQPERKNDNTGQHGSPNGQEPEGDNITILDMAKKHHDAAKDKDENAKFEASYDLASKAVANGQTEITV